MSTSPYPDGLITQMPWTVADALAHTLAEWGVGAAYGVSGANIENFHDAIHRLNDSRLVSVPARSENGAAFMADAHARIHGGLGVCCSTSGGGMMNLAVGVAEAYQEGIPMLAIVGQVPRRVEGCGGFQDSSGIGATVDALGMWRAISKDVRRIQAPHTIWDDLHAVVSAAVNGRRGPGVLLIPKDIFDQPAPPRPLHWHRSLKSLTRKSLPNDTAIDTLALRLRESQRPVLIAGPMIRGSERQAALINFATRCRIPVVTTLADVGAFPVDHPLHLGVIGTAGHPSTHRYLNEEADLILAVGTRLEVMFRAPISTALKRCTTVYMDDDSTLSLGNERQDFAVIGELATSFEGLLDGRLEGRAWQGRPPGYQLQRFVPRRAQSGDDGNSPARDDGLLQSEALRMLEGILPVDGQILFDAGNCAASAMHYMTPPRGASTTVALGMGGMGYAIAGAVGAQLGGAEGSRTVVICGDGAFLMLGMEVHAAMDLELPILYIVLNNGGHGMCVTRQRLYYNGRLECSQYSRPSISRIARGFGDTSRIWTRSADSSASLETALADLSEWSWDGPALLEVVVGAEEIPPFTPFLRADAPVEDIPGREAQSLTVNSVRAA